MSTNSKREWWKVFVNDDEKRVFVGKDGTSGLVRSQYVWRSAKALASESGLPEAKVELILNKYMKKDEVYIKANKNGEQLYAYWDRGDKEIKKEVTADEEIKKDQTSRAGKDKQ